MTDAERAELARLQRIAADESLAPFEAAAQNAWNAIRGLDPEFNSLPMEMRHKLADLAEKYLNGRVETEGDYAPAGFFAAVKGAGWTAANRRTAQRREPDVSKLDSRPDVSIERRVAPADRRAVTTVFTEDTSSHAPVENFGDALTVPAPSAENPEAPFPSLSPDSAAHLSNETFVPATVLRGPLPDGFPGLTILKKADVTTYADLRKFKDFTVIDGVGPKLAIQIAERLEGK